MPVRLTPAVRMLRWVRRPAARLGLAERLGAAAAQQEPRSLLQPWRQQAVSPATSASEQEPQ
jgi:hypothetical protein